MTHRDVDMTSSQTHTLEHRKSQPTPRRLSDGQFAVLLLLPGVALLAGVVLYPLIAALVTAFFEQSLVLPGRTFVGVQNLEIGRAHV